MEKKGKDPRPALGAALVVAFAPVWASAQTKADSERDRLPAVVREAADTHCPGAEIDKLDVENEDGVRVYDIEFKADRGEIEVAEDGTVLDLAVIVELTDVPEAAAAVIREAAGEGGVREVEKSEVRARIEKREGHAGTGHAARVRVRGGAREGRGDRGRGRRQDHQGTEDGGPGVAGRRMRLLLVEDEPDAARMLARGLRAVLARERGVEVRCVSASELPYRGDERLLRQLLMNLLDNAVQHTRRGGHVEARLDVREGVFVVAVKDEGPGVPTEDRERIFERFVRKDAARSRRGEAGLGLPIARCIAEAHGGTLALAHSGPAGSTFLARLPKEPRR